jgi:ubiquitin-like 1-activating enzyme E1 A
MNGLTTEVIKNLVLAGVGKVTLMDDHVVMKQDVRTQFFLRASDVGQKV